MSRHCRHVGLRLGHRHCHMVSSRFLFLLIYLSEHNQTLKETINMHCFTIVAAPKMLTDRTISDL